MRRFILVSLLVYLVSCENQSPQVQHTQEIEEPILEEVEDSTKPEFVQNEPEPKIPELPSRLLCERDSDCSMTGLEASCCQGCASVAGSQWISAVKAQCAFVDAPECTLAECVPSAGVPKCVDNLCSSVIPPPKPSTKRKPRPKKEKLLKRVKQRRKCLPAPDRPSRPCVYWDCNRWESTPCINPKADKKSETIILD